MKLDEIDQIVIEAGGALPVEVLALQESGVDPLGLRQLNLDLMDRAIPGINNVTSHIRPYAFMAWVWTTVGETLGKDGHIHSNEALDCAARLETYYEWSHSLADKPLRGLPALQAALPRKGDNQPFPFKGERWEAFKKNRLGFMAPTEYGPSIKALGALVPIDGGMFKPRAQIAPAVRFIDATVRAVLPARFLAREPSDVRWDEILPLAQALPIDEPSEEERAAFKLLFYDVPDGSDSQAKRRRATINMIRSVMPQGDFMDVSEVRRRLTAGASLSASGQTAEMIEEPAICEFALQARQLQRLAIEAMLNWLEARLHPIGQGGRTSADLAAQADEETKVEDPIAAKSITVGAYLDAIAALAGETGWPAAAGHTPTDVVTLMDELVSIQRDKPWRTPALSLKAIAIVAALAKSWPAETAAKLERKIGGNREARFPIEAMVAQLDKMREKPLVYLWRRLIESWVIGQHLLWSATRSGDGKQRFRIAQDTDGWVRLRASTRRYAPTPDRLATLFALGSECGLFKSSNAGDTKLFGL